MNGNRFLLDTNTVLYLLDLDGDETLADFLFEKETLYFGLKHRTPVPAERIKIYKDEIDRNKEEVI